MSNVTLIIQLILALILIGIVLLQRSEGGGLGIGGGSGGVMTGRQAATALGKATWLVAVAFLSVSLALTIITAREQAGDSVIERAGDSVIERARDTFTGSEESSEPLPGEGLLPPSLPDEPSVPPRAE